MIKADLHTHTIFSKDSLSRVGDVIDAAAKAGLSAIAITDHDSIEGALEAQRVARRRNLPLQVILGEEVRTDKGDLLVYFVKKRIAPGKLGGVLAEAKRQGAVCCAAHPYDFARHGIALGKLPAPLLAKIGCVEVFNARVPMPSQNARAMAFALRNRLALLAGSDAHHPSEVGAAYVEFYGVSALDAASLVGAHRKIGGKSSSPFVRFYSRYAVLRKKLAGLFRPRGMD
ncbi:MAG: PHP domain-containing protein [Candidatus Micrarchaeota archaeon]|nr:PHP domain-containing protein [Candidatus Micrarchaeota archaeon]